MKIPFLICMLVLSGPVNAAWLAATGLIASVSIYPHTDTVLFQLESVGTAAGCADASVFAIDGSALADRRKQLVAVPMSAQARNSIVTVAYADAGGCVGLDGAVNAFRAAMRV